MYGSEMLLSLVYQKLPETPEINWYSPLFQAARNIRLRFTGFGVKNTGKTAELSKLVNMGKYGVRPHENRKQSKRAK